ncbi:MAG: hydroxymethylbilane synthase [Planctomycetota bacterium]
MTNGDETRTIRIATRASKLALWQAEYVRGLLIEQSPGTRVELVEVISTGDAVRDRPLFEVGGVGIFTKEVQEAVLDGRADLAVHSLKDLPTLSPKELILAAVPKRASPNDVLLAPRHRVLERLPRDARVATSSLRRRAQLLRLRPDLQIVDIRGNVETRIRKLHEQELDGLILARAGIDRLGLEGEITEELPIETMLPAVGQGALGIECRADDRTILDLLSRLEDRGTRASVEAERSFLRVIEGGCQVPAGGFGTVIDDLLHLRGRVLDETGAHCCEGSIEGTPAEAVSLGAKLAQHLLSEGAGSFLRRRRV